MRALVVNRLKDPLWLCAVAITAGVVAYDTRYLCTRVATSTTSSTAAAATASDGRTRRRPNRIVVGVIDRNVGLHVPEFEPVACIPAGARVPYRASVDVDDKVAVTLEGELAIVVLAVVVGRVAAPHGVRSHACSVVDDKVAVGLEVEAYAIVEANEGWACGLDVPRLTRCPCGVRVPFG